MMNEKGISDVTLNNVEMPVQITGHKIVTKAYQGFAEGVMIDK